MVSIYTYLTPLLADEVWHKCILSSFSLGPNLTALEAAILELSWCWLQSQNLLVREDAAGGYPVVHNGKSLIFDIDLQRSHIIWTTIWRTIFIGNQIPVWIEKRAPVCFIPIFLWMQCYGIPVTELAFWVQSPKRVSNEAITGFWHKLRAYYTWTNLLLARLFIIGRGLFN